MSERDKAEGRLIEVGEMALNALRARVAELEAERGGWREMYQSAEDGRDAAIARAEKAERERDERDALRARVAELEAENERLIEASDIQAGDCSHGVHGPWCREWRKMEKHLTEATELLTDAANRPFACYDHGCALKCACGGVDAHEKIEAFVKGLG